MRVESIKFKKIIAVVSLLSLLIIVSGCSNEVKREKKSAQRPRVSLEKSSAPSSCETSVIYEKIKEINVEYRFIPTKWEPAEGTDLALAYANKGLACTFGELKSETGFTVLWAPSTQAEYKSRERYWLDNLYVEESLPGYNYTLKLKDGEYSPDGKPRYSLITFKNNLWIELNYSTALSEEQVERVLKYSWDSVKAVIPV